MKLEIPTPRGALTADDRALSQESSDEQMPFEFVVLEALLITLSGTLRTDAESCAADKARLLAVLRRGMSGKLLTEAGRLKRRIDEVQSAVRGAKVRPLAFNCHRR